MGRRGRRRSGGVRIDRRDAIQEELSAAQSAAAAMADARRMMEKWGSATSAAAGSRYY